MSSKLSDDLKALAKGVVHHSKTGFTVSPHKLEELARKAEELEQAVAEQGKKEHK